MKKKKTVSSPEVSDFRSGVNITGSLIDSVYYSPNGNKRKLVLTLLKVKRTEVQVSHDDLFLVLITEPVSVW